MTEIHSTASARSCHDCKAPPMDGLTRCENHNSAAIERSRRWRKANPARVLEHRKSDYERNREKIKARSRAWSAANKERKASVGAAWAKANPDRVLNSRVKKFGLSAEQYTAILDSQGHRCAICGTDKPGGRGRFAVDHDHAKEAKGVMVVRGLLCVSCNRGLGYFVDNASALRRAAQYIEDGGFGNVRTA